MVDVTYDTTFYDADFVEKKIILKSKLLDTVCDFVGDYIKKNKYYMPIIVQAGTGIGKSTDLVYKLYEYNTNYNVNVSQNTIINAQSISRFIAQKYNKILGQQVLYSTSDDALVSTERAINYMTTGKLLGKLQNLDEIEKTIYIIDEAHSTSKDMGQILSEVRRLTRNHNSQSIFLIMSATISLPAFMSFYESQIAVAIQGKNQPITELYVDDTNLQQSAQTCEYVLAAIKSIIQPGMNKAVDNAIQQLRLPRDKGIMAFLPTGAQIQRVAGMIAADSSIKAKVFICTKDEFQKNPQLSTDAAGDCFKIILATNVVETGYTFEHLYFVIDSLMQLTGQYNPLAKIRVMKFILVSKNAAMQRRGRVGRTAAGIYMPCCTRKQFNELAVEQPPALWVEDMQLFYLSIYNQMDTIQFVNPIPNEIVIDAKQAAYYAGFFENATNNTYRLFMFQSHDELSIFDRYLFYLAHINEFQLYQVAILLSNLIKCRDKDRDLPQNLEHFKYFLVDYEPKNSQQSAAMLYGIQDNLTDKNINMFSGKSIADNMDEFIGKCVSIAYAFNTMKQQFRNGNLYIYETVFGARVTIRGVQKVMPEFLICHQFGSQYGQTQVKGIQQIGACSATCVWPPASAQDKYDPISYQKSAIKHKIVQHSF